MNFATCCLLRNEDNAVVRMSFRYLSKASGRLSKEGVLTLFRGAWSPAMSEIGMRQSVLCSSVESPVLGKARC